jgi:hypothetical protein
LPGAAAPVNPSRERARGRPGGGGGGAATPGAGGEHDGRGGKGRR